MSDYTSINPGNTEFNPLNSGYYNPFSDDKAVITDNKVGLDVVDDGRDFTLLHSSGNQNNRNINFQMDGNPDLIPPTGNININQTETLVNDFFAPSFLAAFTSVMNEILNLNRESRFLEAQTEIESRERLIDMAKTTSELTKLSYDLQAQEKMIEAVACFVNAAIGFVTFGAYLGAGVRAGKNAEKRINDQIEEKEGQVGKLDKELKGLKEGQVNVGSNPSAAQKTAAKEYQDKIDAKQAEKKVADEELAKMVNNKDDLIRQEKAREQEILNRYIQTGSEALKNSVNGVSNTMEALLKSEQGVVNSLKDLLDGYVNAERTYLENTQKARDQFLSNFTKLIDDLIQIVRSNYKTHSLNPN